MNVTKVQTAQPNNNVYKHTAVASVAGALAGAGARYIVPTQKELSSIINKDAVDTFTSSAATSLRGSNRSILKYAGVGALVAAGLTLLSKIFPAKKNIDNSDYSKMGALLDAPDYAVEIMWYGE